MSDKIGQLKMWASDGKLRLTDCADTELVLNMLAETSATDISKQKNPHGFEENADVAQKGGSVAKAARRQLEKQLGHDVVSPLSASKAIKKQLEDKDEND